MQLAEGARGKGRHACNLFLNSLEEKFMKKRMHVYVCVRGEKRERERERQRQGKREKEGERKVEMQ